uniref:Reverse transcriptase/retrotransposon-derived protein RNase H-like domain-containing protein n=1 Tax=Amphimedon queenslandica TaxID=400682 RepID=A0A1X7SNP9_AMPQE
MVNQLSKFSPNLAERTKPLRDLLSKRNQWYWGSEQDRAFLDLKNDLNSARTLALFEPNRETRVSADASSYGLGAILRQKQTDGTWKPVAYVLRSMTQTEQRYAQIEKEALALTWACERLNQYLLGSKFTLETDHKPLIPLLSTKNLEDLPIR